MISLMLMFYSTSSVIWLQHLHASKCIFFSLFSLLFIEDKMIQKYKYSLFLKENQ